MRVCISEGNINGAIAAVDDNVEVRNGLVQLADAPDARRANPSDHEHYAAALRPQRIGFLLLPLAQVWGVFGMTKKSIL